MLFGKRVATPQVCLKVMPDAGTTIKFEPCLARKFAVFFTPAFTQSHTSTMDLFRRASAILGQQCLVQELDTAENAHALGTAAMVVDSLPSFSDLVRRLARVQRDRANGGSYR